MNNCGDLKIMFLFQHVRRALISPERQENIATYSELCYAVVLSLSLSRGVVIMSECSRDSSSKQVVQRGGRISSRVALVSVLLYFVRSYRSRNDNKRGSVVSRYQKSSDSSVVLLEDNLSPAAVTPTHRTRRQQQQHQQYIGALPRG